MSDVVARSPIMPTSPVVEHGWELSGRRSTAQLTLVDLTPLAKVGVRADPDRAMAHSLAAPFGHAARDDAGGLVIGSGPGEWLVLAGVGEQHSLRERLEAMADRARESATELVSVIDLTNGRALIRLTGPTAAQVLAKVCGIDLSDTVTPHGAAFRSSVANLVTDVVRDDRGSPPTPSYLLHCERSSGQYLFDAVLDAGAEFGIDVDGFRPPGI